MTLGNAKKILVLSLALFLLISSSAAGLDLLGEDEETKRAHVEINGLSDISVVRDEGGEILERNGRFLLIEGTYSIFSSLESRSMEVRVVDERDQEPMNIDIDDMNDTDAEAEQDTDYPFADYYPSVDDLHAWYDDLEVEYPDLVETHNYGTSWEGSDLWAVEISSDEDTRVEEKPGVLIDGALHAREWSSVQTSAYYMWRILDEYETNETINWLVNNRRLFVIPMTNPDGYIYDGDGDLDAAEAWRKNRNDSTPTDAVGVDLNRNWDVDFGGEGTSDDPSSDQYHGEAPFSEYETNHLKEFLLDKDIDSYQNIHSHADTLLIPYMHTDDPSPHDDWYRGMADHMTSLTSMLGDEDEQYSYGQPGEEIGYSAAGGAADWAYAKEGMQGLTFEIHTPDSGRGGFYPDEEYIMPINKDIDDSLIYQSRVADIDLGDGPMGDGGEDLFPPVPYLVYGEVESEEGDPISDVEVEVENEVTGETLSIETDSNGYYELNFGNLVDEGYDVGDSFTIEAEETSEDFAVGEGWGTRKDLTVGSVPPSIEITRPTGGETWSPGNDEEITWDTSEGDGSITEIDLEYSVDGGSSWSYIEQGEDDTGSYLWTIPDEQSDDARIRALVHDDEGMRGEDTSDPFMIKEDTGEYTLTIGVEGEGSTVPEEGTHQYEEGKEAKVSAEPDEGWYFDEWTGDQKGTESTIEITMDQDKEITAVFEEETPEEYELTINVEGEGSTDPEEGAHSYTKGHEVAVTATPDEGWYFDEWTGDQKGTDEEITIMMDEDKEITAHFDTDLDVHELTINIDGQGSTEPEEGTHQYEEGKEAKVSAEPDEGWYFDEWTGDQTSTESTIEIIMDQDKEITAVFKEETLEEYELTINVEGEGGTDPEEGLHEYTEGDEVTVTATPAEDWYFEEWTGDHESEEEEITITMDEEKEITAVFATEEPTHELTIEIKGQGTTDPEEGLHEYIEDTSVTLTATAAEDWYFEEWTGDYEGTEEEITITMDSDKEITAWFEKEELEPAYFAVDIVEYDAEVEEGEKMSIKFNVTNTGGVEGSQFITLYLDGEQVEVYGEVELGPNENYQGEFILDVEEVGEHELAVDSNDSQESIDINVMGDDDPDEEDDGTFVSDYWWLIIVLLIGIIAGIVLLFVMENTREKEGSIDHQHAPEETESSEKPTEEEKGEEGWVE